MSYITVEVLPTTSRVKLIDKKRFTKTTLDKNWETFIIYISTLKVTKSLIYPSYIDQITVL